MAKLSLLDMVQDILSDMNDDEVNSIADTLESLQVARIIKSTYEELMAGQNWPHLRGMFQLEPSGDVTKPTHMKLPVDVKELTEVRYDKAKVGETRAKYQDVSYMFPDEFLTLTNSYNEDNSDVISVIDYSGVEILVKNNKAPSYWTSFDDEYVVFNSYDVNVDTTLQNTKTQCHGYMSPTFTLTDSFIPDMPDEMFPMLLAEAKSACFIRIKEVADQKAEQQSTRQRFKMNQRSWKAAGGIRFPNYGRRGKK